MIQQFKRTTNFVLNHPLGGQSVLRSLARLALWQARTSLSPGPHKVPFVNRTQLWARKGEAGVTGNIYVGLHEFSDMAFVAHMLRKDDIFADIGANAGSYTILASGVAGARTIAIEPVPSTRERLEQNVALNRIEHLVTIKACALSARSGCVEITADADCANQVITECEELICAEAPANKITVPALSADEAFEKEKPIIAKIDVEGHEDQLLRGADAFISSPDLKAMIIELSWRSGESVVNLLEKCGFQSIEYQPFQRRLAKAEPTVGKGNTLFIRTTDRHLINDRLVAAKPIFVHGRTI